MLKAFLLGTAVLIGGARTAAADAALDLAERNYQHNRVLDSTADLTMTLTSKAGETRVRKLTSTTKLKAGTGENMRLLSFSFPEDVRGTTTLLIEQNGRDDDLWIYLPALKKVRRLVSQNKRDSFVGSDLSFGDILGHKPVDWNFKLVGDDSLDGKPVNILEATPKTPEIARNTGYSLRKLWLAKDTAAALRTDYWDEAGQLLKSVQVADVKVVDAAHEKTQYMRLDASNVQSGRRTQMVYDNFKANAGVSAELFSPLAIAQDE